MVAKMSALEDAENQKDEKMSQSNLRHVFSKLRVEVGPRRRFRNPLGPEGRLLKMRKTVTALVKHERIELFYHRGDESRAYAERLISEAIRFGEKHRETMELASYWLLEKQLVHKLFKVLVPRYQDCKLSYTRLWRAPREYPGNGRDRCILELRGNIYPNLIRDPSFNFNLLHNRLLDEMRKEYELAEKGEEKETVPQLFPGEISEDKTLNLKPHKDEDRLTLEQTKFDSEASNEETRT